MHVVVHSFSFCSYRFSQIIIVATYIIVGIWFQSMVFPVVRARRLSQCVIWIIALIRIDNRSLHGRRLKRKRGQFYWFQCTHVNRSDSDCVMHAKACRNYAIQRTKRHIGVYNLHALASSIELISNAHKDESKFHYRGSFDRTTDCVWHWPCSNWL